MVDPITPGVIDPITPGVVNPITPGVVNPITPRVGWDLEDGAVFPTAAGTWLRPADFF